MNLVVDCFFMQCWEQCLFFYWLLEIPSSKSRNRCHDCKAVIRSSFEHFTPMKTHLDNLIRNEGWMVWQLSIGSFRSTSRTPVWWLIRTERAQNCKQNVFTWWHIFIYLLNNYLVRRNDVTGGTVYTLMYQPLCEQYLFLHQHVSRIKLSNFITL